MQARRRSKSEELVLRGHLLFPGLERHDPEELAHLRAAIDDELAKNRESLLLRSNRRIYHHWTSVLDPSFSFFFVCVASDGSQRSLVGFGRRRWSWDFFGVVFSSKLIEDFCRYEGKEGFNWFGFVFGGVWWQKMGGRGTWRWGGEPWRNLDKREEERIRERKRMRKWGEWRRCMKGLGLWRNLGLHSK